MSEWTVCWACGTPSRSEGHHVFPQRLGGTDEDNLLDLCKSCHEKVTFGYGSEMYMQFITDNLQKASTPSWVRLMFLKLVEYSGSPISVKSLTQNIITNERNIVSIRTKKGLQKAKARGVRLGQKPLAIHPDRVVELRNQGLSFRSIGDRLGISSGSAHKLFHLVRRAA